ncbi:hypothetical protein BOA8489_02940 [Boseongicola aestuarii]|uniref:Tetratricopeptide repeat protein n=1 Tax=Boseongicola aestuarii TaxID=1470561 RepID=A0A238J3A3_9RHOB|nr:hypothetical protein BOA8489_02940 [Boseongicola aestuarii]
MPALASDVLPQGDPALLNRVAWRCRWSSREKSEAYAKAALRTACEAPGETMKVPRGFAYLTLAWQAKWRGEIDASMAYCLDCENCLSEIHHPESRAHGYSILGVLHYSRNRLDLAASAVKRGLGLVNPDEHIEAYIDLLTTRATIQRYKGDSARSGLTLGLARDLATGQELARVEHNIARGMMRDDVVEKGLQHAKTSLELCHKHANRVVLPYAQEVLGACQMALGDFTAAENAFTDGLGIAIEDRDFRAQCQIIQRHAALEHARHDLERARDLNRFGAQIAKEMGYDLWSRDFALALAGVYEDLGDFRKSLDEHKRAWRFEKARRT